MNGLPLGPIDAAAVLMLLWLAARGVRVPAAAAAGLALAATFIAAAAIPGDAGLRARYFANAAASGGHERSIEFPADAFTRIDDRLDFNEAREFPLPFFNDNTRFNFYKVGEPNRRRLEFAVRWSGLWWVDEPRPRLYLDAPGSSGEIFVDGTPVMSLSPGSGSPIVFEVPLTPGWHRLDVTYSSQYYGQRRFSAGLMRGDRRQPFDSTNVVTQQIRDWQMRGVRWLHTIKTGFDILALATVAAMFVLTLLRTVSELRVPAAAAERRRQVLWLFAAVAATEALVTAWPWSQQNMVLIGGDDTMTYETYARDILLNGILMNGGLPPGQGEPFYYQAFYPYFLAATHAVFGEMLFGAVLVQRLLIIFAIWKLVEIATTLAGERVWTIALPLAGAFMAWKFWPIAGQPLSEALYVPLLVAATAALMRAGLNPGPSLAVSAGLLCGLTAITRSTALLAWVITWPIFGWSWRRVPGKHVLLGGMIVATLAVFSLISVRNWIVAARFVPASTEFGITLLGGNEVPPEVKIDLTRRASFYRSAGISDLTAIVIEYALTAPGLFAQNIGRKALFVLGFYEPYAPGWGYSPVYIAVWLSAIAGAIVTLRARAVPTAVALLPAVVSLTQFVVIVIVYPKGERLIVPIHTLLIPYASIAIWSAFERLRPQRVRS